MMDGTRKKTARSKPHSGVVALLIFVAALLANRTEAGASVTIVAPPDGSTFQAELEGCETPPCSVDITFVIDVVGADTQRVELHSQEGSDPFTFFVCFPGSDIEPDFDPCPQESSFTVEDTLSVHAGSYSIVAVAIRPTGTEESAPVHFTVQDALLPPTGPVTLSAVVPSHGAPRTLVREPETRLDPGFCICTGVPSCEAEANICSGSASCNPTNPDEGNTCFSSETSARCNTCTDGGLYDPDLAYDEVWNHGIRAKPDFVEIQGDNLANPFLRVYLAPKPFGEPTLTPDSPLPLGDYCLWEAEVLEREQTKLVVELPELPSRTPTTCGDTAGPEGDTFSPIRNWRWLIRRPRPEPELPDEWSAIPSPRLVPWHDAPPFKVVKPTYPTIDGFLFANHKTDANFKEFLTVYGNNAYICLDCLPIIGCGCFLKVIDPLYTLWTGVYFPMINASGGTCNGMSATSLLFAHEDLQTEDFQPGVLFPAGFIDPTPFPNSIRYSENNNSQFEGVPAYKDTNFCTPVCSPPKPANLWAQIRMNHGVQISREFLAEAIQTSANIFINPNIDDDRFDGIPEITLERIRDHPQNYVLCFTKPFSGGHCVTPYKVEGNRIYIYDNNNPRDVGRYIDIFTELGNRKYDYPARRADGKSLADGKLIVAYPLDIWRHGRHMIGLQEFEGEFDVLYTIIAGDADMTVTDGEGGRWGWEEDGTLTEALPGAMAMPTLGPPDAIVRQVPLLIGMDQPAPTVEANAYGGRYLFHATQGGAILQLESADAEPGDKDRVETGYASGALSSFDFTPEHDAPHVVPRIGLVLGDQERAAFHWLGLSVPGGGTAGFAGDKEARAVRYRNDTAQPSHHVLALDHASGLGGNHGRMVYGPFEVPPGGGQRVVLADWPVVDEVVSELDLDGDGVADRVDRIPGRPVPSPLVAGGVADVSVAKSATPEMADLGDPLEYTVVVRNQGPETAASVLLVDALPTFATVQAVDTTKGTCSATVGGVTCELGELAIGEEVEISYVVIASLPGTLANGAIALSVTGDPDLTNNTAVALVETPVLVDVKPGSSKNPVQVEAHGLIPVAILGQPGFDVSRIDPETLAFGPAGATPVHRSRAHFEDVNDDGELDLLSHYRVQETGLTWESTEGCVHARSFNGRTLRGCDAIAPVTSGK